MTSVASMMLSLGAVTVLGSLAKERFNDEFGGKLFSVPLMWLNPSCVICFSFAVSCDCDLIIEVQRRKNQVEAIYLFLGNFQKKRTSENFCLPGFFLKILERIQRNLWHYIS